MKRLLLINPPQKHTIEGNLPKYVDESRGNIPPLGLLYTASAILQQQDKDWEVKICDMSAGSSLEHNSFLSDYQVKVNTKPDLVGITTTTFTLLDVLEVAKQVKAKWNVPVVLGGIHPTIYPEETASLPNIDCVFTGESEATFPDMIDSIATKTIRIAEGKQPDIQALPYPARHLIDQEKYYSVLGQDKVLTSMLTSRGCPYRCIFCHRETMGKKFRARTTEQVITELRLVRDTGIKEVLVYDDTFTVDMTRAKDICKGIIDSKLDISFDIRARVDRIDSELLQLLKATGCKRVHYGVEASSNRILARLKKGITIEQVRRAFGATRQVGIETLAYFIIGSPGESYHNILETIEFAKELRPDYCHFSVMTPYPATPLYQMGLDQGLYHDYWRDFAKCPSPRWEAPFWPELDRSLLLELLDKAYKSFYWRPSQIIKEAVKTKSLASLGNKAHGAMSMIFSRRQV